MGFNSASHFVRNILLICYVINVAFSQDPIHIDIESDIPNNSNWDVDCALGYKELTSEFDCDDGGTVDLPDDDNSGQKGFWTTCSDHCLLTYTVQPEDTSFSLRVYQRTLQTSIWDGIRRDWVVGDGWVEMKKGSLAGISEITIELYHVAPSLFTVLDRIAVNADLLDPVTSTTEILDTTTILDSTDGTTQTEPTSTDSFGSTSESTPVTTAETTLDATQGSTYEPTTLETTQGSTYEPTTLETTQGSTYETTQGSTYESTTLETTQGSTYEPTTLETTQGSTYKTTQDSTYESTTLETTVDPTTETSLETTYETTSIISTRPTTLTSTIISESTTTGSSTTTRGSGTTSSTTSTISTFTPPRTTRTTTPMPEPSSKWFDFFKQKWGILVLSFIGALTFTSIIIGSALFVYMRYGSGMKIHRKRKSDLERILSRKLTSVKIR